jgi:glutamate/tyrosine decarboxylase-like PLP-dependent enzyme
VLKSAGWDVDRQGLRGAPALRVLAGAERHATIDRAVRLLGIGEDAIEELAADANGAMDADALERALASGSDRPTIVCAQSGNVNTGACDDLRRIGAATRAAGAWLHLDGAFGLWAAASPAMRGLVDGIELAGSWATDGHKWLNVPYDAGYAFCADPGVHAAAMGYSAAYLAGQEEGRVFGGGDFVLDSSRRARGFATWAALLARGRTGVAELVDRFCALARRFAAGLDALEGVDVVNDVVLKSGARPRG